jgi:tetratricopeptide (TPR) repeat protein
MKTLFAFIALFAIVLAASSPVRAAAPPSRCEDADKDCKEFEQLLDAQQPEKITARYEAAKTARYSEIARRYIGEAYLALASREDITPEQELGYYEKALEVKHYIAYMGLYFFYAQKDEDRALGFLREYVKTKPPDTVPYVILGEAELNKQHYELADTYLREAKKVAHAHSPRVDWLLFRANYLLKNYQFAAEMFGNAVAAGTFEKELKALKTDPRFEGIGKRTEFRKFDAFFP